MNFLLDKDGTKDHVSGSYACNLCNDVSKTVRGVMAHFISEHAWKDYEYSAIMKQPHLSLINVTVSEGIFNCSCGMKSPRRFLEEEDSDYLARQWLLIHRLVDPPHFQKQSKKGGMRTFPEDLVKKVNDKTETYKAGLQEIPDLDSSGDLSLPDISKYSRIGKLPNLKNGKILRAPHKPGLQCVAVHCYHQFSLLFFSSSLFLPVFCF